MLSQSQTACFLTLLMILSSISVLMIDIEAEELEAEEESLNFRSVSRTGNFVDVPSWKVNDVWNYNGNLDLVNYIASSGVSTNLQTMDGTLQTTVTDMYTTIVDNRSTLVYELESIGEYDSNGVITLEGNSGCLYVSMETTEIVRASDLSSVEQEATFDIVFDPYVWGSCRTWMRQTIAELTVLNEYSPPLEGHDFPISVGDNWDQDYYQETSYSGSSNYVTIPPNTADSNTSSWEVVSQGYSGVGYTGCIPSYNISSSDSNGDDTGYKWYCPAIRGNIKTETVEGIGFTAIHRLSTYQASSRAMEINVELEYALAPINMDMSAWVNVTQNGQPVANQDVEFRYEIGGVIQTVTTGSDGSAEVVFNTGNSPDDSDSGGDLGSHGVIAWIPTQKLVGAATVTIDPDIHEVDLVANEDGVTVERTRGERTVSLNPQIGFNAIRGDTLTFSIPVINRGLTSSPVTTIQVTGPDGSVSNAAVPSLPSLGEARVELDWIVPSNQQYGDMSITFVVDPSDSITEDGNRSNNYGQFGIFIGDLPTASLMIPQNSLTLNEVTFNGLSSWDPDGGEVYCQFTVETLSGSTLTSTEDDCIFEHTWDDDGTFLVTLTITDEESDTSYTESNISILNRAPEITVEAESSTVPVFDSITFEITERQDLDTQNPQAPIDIAWNVPCEEGTIGLRCTITPESEGELTISVDAMDDDGAITTESLSIQVTNVAPYDPRVEVMFDGNRLLPNQFGLYTVNEGDILTIRGFISDSENDMDTLVHEWHPDVEGESELVSTQVGRTSLIQHSFNTEGQHLSTLVVTDNDGESSETLVIPFQVNNIAPEIRPFSPPLPVAEDNDIQLSIIVDDTLYDMQSLALCYDLDPDTNSDNIGNSTDDCDQESSQLIHSWPDSNSAPQSISFHATDDDGASAWVSIPIDIRNVKPNVGATTSNYKPIAGGLFILSGNGTTDSQYDMANMLYHWDMDINSDSDGDGDPANDVDAVGKLLEWSFDSQGSKTIQLTVSDGDATDSIRLIIQVQKAPLSVVGILTSPIFIVTLIILTAGIAGYLVLQKKQEEEYKEPTQAKGRKVSMDDAFDDPGFDPFSEEQSKQRVDVSRIESEIENTTEDSPKEDSITVDYPTEKEEYFVHEDESPPQETITINDVLSGEDIEALMGEEE